MNYQEFINTLVLMLDVSRKQVVSSINSSAAFRNFKDIKSLEFEVYENDPYEFLYLFGGKIPNKMISVRVKSTSGRVSLKAVYAWHVKLNGKLIKKVSSVSQVPSYENCVRTSLYFS